MIRDEGYIKFKIDWQKTPPLKLDLSAGLIAYRQKLHKKEWIGVYPDGIGFGNLSQRLEGNTFIISASKTGQIKDIKIDHFSKVTEINVDQNEVKCEGLMQASSESMSHAIIYETLPDVNVVLHIHDLELWENNVNIHPTTDVFFEYGTPEMAYAIRDIVLAQNSNAGTIIMAGHEEGIITYGTTFEEAYDRLLALS